MNASLRATSLRLAAPARRQALPLHCLLAGLLACRGVAAAEPDKPAEQPAAAAVTTDSGKPAVIQSVEVKGRQADYDPRRDDTASKSVMRREEIVQYGDTNVYDVLKRAPGVTVVGNSVRMRGLGAGYTQILVDGSRPPPGFSMDTLSPDQIERIEIIRSATAEYSMQAIAGTINIVLRKAVDKAQRDGMLLWSRNAQGSYAGANAQVGDKRGNLAYLFSANVAHPHSASRSHSEDRYFVPDGRQTIGQTSEGAFARESDVLTLSTRLNWKRANGDDVGLQLRGQHERTRSPFNSRTDPYLGAFYDPLYVEYASADNLRRWTGSGDVTWTAKVAGGKLDFKAGSSWNGSADDDVSTSYTARRAKSLERTWDSEVHSRQDTLNLKFNRSILDGHALSTGVEASRVGSAENVDHRDVIDQGPSKTARDRFEPAVLRIAGYVQDEWNVTPQWSVYVGARWERIRTDSTSHGDTVGVESVRSTNQVLTPVAQTLYKFPDKSGRQLRLALLRTFKAPTLEQLTARRYNTINNTQFAADRGGNPNLRPELATGVDLTYEHFFKPGASFMLGASSRRIVDYIRTRLEQDPSGRWVNWPVNSGNASVRTLEADLKLPLRSIFPAAPAFDLRMSAARNWSSVDSVPGPDNRLDAQIPRTATAGIDYRDGPLSTGAFVAWRAGGPVRISVQQSQYAQSRTDAQAYLAWKFSPRYQARLALSNLAARDYYSRREYADANGRRVTESFSPSSRSATLTLEMKY